MIYMLYSPIQNTGEITTSFPSGDVYSAIGKVLAFLFVVALAYFATKLIAKSTKGRMIGRGGKILVVEAVNVGLQSSVQIVKAGEQFFLIGVTRTNISLISEIDSGLFVPESSENFDTKKIEMPFERYLKNISSIRMKKEDTRESEIEDGK